MSRPATAADDAGRRRGRVRSGPGLSVLACAAGAVLILIAQAAVWANADIPRATGGVEHLVVHGHDVEPGLRAIGVALLALAVALLATRGWLRRVVGLAVAAVGAAGIAVAASGPGATGPALLHRAFAPTVHSLSTGPNPWWVLAVVGGVVSLAAGLAAVVWGGSWGGLGQRYDAPAAVPAPAPEPTDDAAAWRSLDRGEDPTA